MFQNSLAIPAVPASQSRSFVVARNARGQWVARERHGLIEGVFLTQRDAVRFALFETGSNSAAVVVDTAGPSRHH
jgi:hypothetical protein